MSKNKVKFGLSDVHIAKMVENDDGSISYEDPIEIPGAVNIALDAEGDTSPFYADNIIYYNAIANNGYAGDLELAQVPDEFLTEILGQTTDANGAIIESTDDTTSPFALMFMVKGDKKNRKSVYYNCTATRPSTEASTTEDSSEPQTDTLSLTMAPRSTDNKIKATLELSDTNSDAYESFFDSVYEEVESA